MKYTILIVTAIPMLFALAGCGGSGTTSTTTTNTSSLASPFSGTYSGAANDLFYGNGTMNFTVTPSGSVTGTFTVNGTTVVDVVTGSIAATGAANLSVAPPAGIAGGGSVNDTGVLTLDVATRLLSGSLAGTANLDYPPFTQPDTLAVQVTRQ